MWKEFWIFTFSHVIEIARSICNLSKKLWIFKFIFLSVEPNFSLMIILVDWEKHPSKECYELNCQHYIFDFLWCIVIRNIKSSKANFENTMTFKQDTFESLWQFLVHTIYFEPIQGGASTTWPSLDSKEVVH